MDWHEIWERKGNHPTDDLKELDGFEHTTIDPESVAHAISAQLDVCQDDRLLEVGCGAGLLAQYLDCWYVGIDYAQSLVKKHIRILDHTVVYSEANNLTFKDNSFDKVFAFSVFHYFPNKIYVKKAIDEMKRTAKKSIFIGDLPLKSHRGEHLLFTKEDFDGWYITEGLYNPDRINVKLDL